MSDEFGPPNCPKCGYAHLPTLNCQAESSFAAPGLLAAVAEYFDWLTNAEIAAEEMGNVQYRDAMARASSELGLILIKHKLYEPEQAANYV
jgi:hypothetical protein